MSRTGWPEVVEHAASIVLDALDPNDLRALFQAALDSYWDVSAYEAMLDREQDDLHRLRDVAGGAA